VHSEGLDEVKGFHGSKSIFEVSIIFNTDKYVIFINDTYITIGSLKQVRMIGG